MAPHRILQNNVQEDSARGGGNKRTKKNHKSAGRNGIPAEILKLGDEKFNRKL
ncbi:hypothetical protein ILUMI_17578 [Ignelater luminosus]|uniref:Uncharacterized protein n=1 Tax=Ignelater luminosus TaxID=2038154 RepID=A0A8K0CS05_IGNLU|nr:hypothetical protein ILUMI_17578 [Ignelater luminosus]